MSDLVLRNRQRVRRIDTPLLRRLIRALLAESFPAGPHELCFHFVTASEMATVNEQFLNHTGPTDVITFDYSNLKLATSRRKRAGEGGTSGMRGEIFVCVDEAIAQARQFRTTWQSELVRYIVHGLLHLQGHDDKRAAAQRTMKREENRLLRALAGRFPFSKLERRPLRR